MTFLLGIYGLPGGTGRGPFTSQKDDGLTGLYIEVLLVYRLFSLLPFPDPRSALI